MEKICFDYPYKLYSSLIKWLIESNQIYTGIDSIIQWTFALNDNPVITATVNRNTNILSVNIAFVDEAVNSNKLFDIEHFLLHEMRHIYQHEQIEKYKNKENTVDSKFIELWIKEGQNYAKSLNEKGEENLNYFKQDCELDAYAFSFAVMHHKYHGIYDSKLYVPKIYKNELKQDFDTAVEDFLKSF